MKTNVIIEWWGYPGNDENKELVSGSEIFECDQCVFDHLYLDWYDKMINIYGESFSTSVEQSKLDGESLPPQ